MQVPSQRQESQIRHQLEPLAAPRPLELHHLIHSQLFQAEQIHLQHSSEAHQVH